MKNIILSSLVSIFLVGCEDIFTNGSNFGGTNGAGNTGGTSSSTVNDTNIPTSGIYQSTDSNQVKYLKVINYARSKSRECKNTNGSTSQASRGVFHATTPLKWNDDLYHASFEHSKDMAKSNTFAHQGSGTSSDVTGENLNHKSSSKERIEANGYVEWKNIGENIAYGQSTIEQVVHAWLESPGHCANIMNPAFKEMGIATYEDSNSNYRTYWTNDFGAKQE